MRTCNYNSNFVGGCGSGCNIDFDNRITQGSPITCYLVPQKINKEEQKIKLKALYEDCEPTTAVFSLKEARRFQEGKNDDKGYEFKMAGIKIKKDGSINFNGKYKNEVKACNDGKKAWKKFKKLAKENEEKLIDEEEFEM